MVPSDLEKMTRKSPKRVAPEPLADARDIERDVDAGPLVKRVGFLGVHHHPDELAGQLDGKRGGLRRAEGILAQASHVVAGPPLAHAGLQENLEQAREVGLGQGAHGDSFAVQYGMHHAE